MNATNSSSVFKGVVYKRLSAVETDPSRSNQHEFNGSRPLLELFGREQPRRFTAEFMRMADDGSIESVPGSLTWYDARARHPTRSEYRLYYYSNAVSQKAEAGDTLIIGRRRDGSVFVLIATRTQANAARIAWLFGVEIEPGAAFAAIDLTNDERFFPGAKLGVSVQTAAWEKDSTTTTGPIEAHDLGPVRELQRLLGCPKSSNATDGSTWIEENW